jgi:hypothetical protein
MVIDREDAVCSTLPQPAESKCLRQIFNIKYVSCACYVQVKSTCKNVIYMSEEITLRCVFGIADKVMVDVIEELNA